jgi:hypothetical protein
MGTTKAIRGDIMITRPTSKTKTKVEAPEKIDTSIGLCATCRWNGECMNIGSAARPTHYCDEFDVGTVDDIKSDPQYAPHKSGNGNGKDAVKFQGLCKDCQHREGCAYTETGGTWHCEMYE